MANAGFKIKCRVLAQEAKQRRRHDTIYTLLMRGLRLFRGAEKVRRNPFRTHARRGVIHNPGRFHEPIPDSCTRCPIPRITMAPACTWLVLTQFGILLD